MSSQAVLRRSTAPAPRRPTPTGTRFDLGACDDVGQLRRPSLPARRYGSHALGMHDIEEEGWSNIGTFFAVLNIIVGVGQLALPFAFMIGGQYAIIMLTCLTMLFMYTGFLIKRSLVKFDPIAEARGLPRSNRNWDQLGEVMFGTWSGRIINLFFQCDIFLGYISMLVLAGANLRICVGYYGYDWPEQLCVIICSMGIGCGLLLPTQWLEQLSILGVITTALCTECLIWNYLDPSNVPAVPAEDLLSPALITGSNLPFSATSFAGLSSAFGVIAFCFGGHCELPLVYQSMKNNENLPMVILASFIGALFFYGATGVVGLACWGSATKESFLENLGSDSRGKPLHELQFISPITSGLVALKIVLSSPLCVWPCTAFLENQLGVRDAAGQVHRGRRAQLIFAFMTLTMILATACGGHIVTVMALAGAFDCSFMCLVAPCMLFLALVADDASRLEVLWVKFILYAGAIAGVVSFLGNLLNLAGIIDTGSSTAGHR
eukprot:TRINITY_DN112338_c0_g1_i1.p1 TRINITY_DN112338_c0_g1~~TRINITY_DN112338_c0_g1_i1.p1  ORF type:complete len:492 (+),score=97.28 TRINITY_DN112338_c0_g1_i1:42-1517(+)